MKLGLLTPVLSLSPGKHAPWEQHGSIDDVARIAEAAERLGYDYLTCSEHVAIPVDREGGFGDGHLPGARYWDPLPTFGFLAARQTRSASRRWYWCSRTTIRSTWLSDMALLTGFAVVASTSD